jgi:hypothetical protein
MERCCTMAKSAKVQLRKAGRPPGRVPRPPIQLPNGQTLISKSQAAAELGVVMRTLTLMRPETVMFGGVAYVNREKLAEQIAARLEKRRARR